MSEFQKAVRERARSRPRTVVFPEGDDARTWAAVAEIVEERLLHPVVLGVPDAVQAGLEGAGADLDGVEVQDPRDGRRESLAEILLERRQHRGMTREEAFEWAADELVRGALMVGSEEVDASVAGAAHATGDVMRAAFWCVGPDEGIQTVSSTFYMVVDDFRGRGTEVLSFTDSAVVPDPNPQQLADIAVASCRARRRVVGDEPVVAFMSYSTKGSATGPMIDKMVEGLELFRMKMPEVPADGELQGDAALIPGVGERKAPGSSVAGKANVLVFPDLDAGNLAYKLVQRLAGADAIGPIVQGLRRPCNDLSRGASADDIVEVACITSLMAE